MDHTFDRKTVSVREFLQQILPEDQFPKTRLWGYGAYFLAVRHSFDLDTLTFTRSSSTGDPDFWNDQNDPISFHSPAASMEVWQDK